MKPQGYTVCLKNYLQIVFTLCSLNPRGGGDSHMKVTGMLVVSLRVVNCRFWSHLGCSGQKANIFTHTGIA